MKKFIALTACSLAGWGLCAHAQQLQGDFEADWADCTPWDSKGNTKVAGTTPQGWTVSNVYTILGAKNVAEQVEHNGGKAVKLTNLTLSGQNIPAYITLGTPWATAEVKFSVRNADGGTFGGKDFHYLPDALRFSYLRDNSHSADEPATVVAYLWRGTYTQKDVPGNTSLFSDATKVDMTDRDRHILGIDTPTGGDKEQTDDADLVAKLQLTITGAQAEWATQEVAFDYGQHTTPEQLQVEKANVIFAATDYFGDRSGITANNSLTVDDVEFVYWHALTALSYDGQPLEDFDPEVTDYDLSDRDYDATLPLEWSKKGIGATVEQSYNDDECLLTLTVKGSNYSEADPDTYTTYTLQFKKKPQSTALTALSYGGQPLEGFTPEVTDYNMGTALYDATEPLAYTTLNPEAVVTIPQYDETTGLLTLRVKGGDTDTYPDNRTDYHLQFTPYEAPVIDGTTLPDGGFDEPWRNSRPWDSKHGLFDWSSMSDTQYWPSAPYAYADFVQPMYWNVAHVTGMEGLGATAVGGPAQGTGTPRALTLTNRANPFMATQVVPGFVTLGTPWAGMTGLDWGTFSPLEADGGAFGGRAFRALPDAISLRYKRSHGTAQPNERASVVAYTWKGTYAQSGVAAETPMANPVRTTLYGRDRNILGLPTVQGGEVTKSADAALVALAEGYIEGDAEEWTDFEVPFTYTDPAAQVLPDSINVVLAANDYFADRSLIGEGNTLTVDDVRLVYWHALTSLSYNGQQLDLSNDQTDFELPAEGYKPALLAYVRKGQGAQVTTTYDDATRLLTIRVEAANLSYDPDAFTEYTLHFGQATGITEAALTPAQANEPVYDLRGTRVAPKWAGAKLPQGVYVVAGRKVVVK